jgi:hypothetical protein
MKADNSAICLVDNFCCFVILTAYAVLVLFESVMCIDDLWSEALADRGLLEYVIIQVGE